MQGRHALGVRNACVESRCQSWFPNILCDLGWALCCLCASVSLSIKWGWSQCRTPQTQSEDWRSEIICRKCFKRYLRPRKHIVFVLTEDFSPIKYSHQALCISGIQRYYTCPGPWIRKGSLWQECQRPLTFTGSEIWGGGEAGQTDIQHCLCLSAAVWV